MTSALASSLPAAVPAEGNPFPGPRPYGSDQAELFFGRDRQVEELVSLVLSSRIVLVHAPSGYGKSSLLEAGLLPRLREHDVVVHPTVRLGQAQNRPVLEEGNPFVPLLDDALRAGDQTRPGPSGVHPGSALRLLVVDQFEEVFLDPGLWEERTAFLEHLRRTVEGDDLLRVVLAMRSDFLADLSPYSAQLPNRLVVRFGLDSLDEPQARHAVREAFRRTRVPLGEDQLDRLLDALLTLPPTPGHAQPVRAQHVNLIQLQVLCRRLWDELAAAGSGGQPRDLLDLRASMRYFVDAAVSGVARGSTVGEGLLRRWVEDNLITSGDRRAVLPLEESGAGGLPAEVVLALARARLVQVEQRNRSRWVELTHDSMVSAVQESNAAWAARWGRTRRRRCALAGLLVLALLAAVPLHAPHLFATAEGGPGETASSSGEDELSLAGEEDGPVALSAVWLTPGGQHAQARVKVWAEDRRGGRELLHESAGQVPGYAERVLLVRTAPAAARYVVDVETGSEVGYDFTLVPLQDLVVRPQPSSRQRVSIAEGTLPVAVETQPGDLLQVAGEAEVLSVLEVRGGTVVREASAGQPLLLLGHGRHVLLSNHHTRASSVEVGPVPALRDLLVGATTSVPVDDVALVRLGPPSFPSLVTAWCSTPVQVSVLDGEGGAVETHSYGGASGRGASALVGVGGDHLVLLEREAGSQGAAECRVRVDDVPGPTGGTAVR